MQSYVYYVILPVTVIVIVMALWVYWKTRTPEWKASKLDSAHDWYRKFCEGLSFSWIKSLLILVAIWFAGVLIVGSLYKASLPTSRSQIGGTLLLTVILIAVIVSLGRILVRISKSEKKDTDEDKRTWWEKHIEKHPKQKGLPTAVVLIIIGLALTQWVLYYTDFGPWLLIWDHKAFWVIQIALVCSLAMLRLTEPKTTERLIVRVTLWSMAIVSAFVVGNHYRKKVWNTRPESESVKRPAYIPIATTEPVEKKLVPKGAPISFPYEDLKSFDAVTFYAKIDDGEWKGPLPPGALHDALPPGIKRLALRCDTQDFWVTLRKPPPPES
jgi:hypothetical protein